MMEQFKENKMTSFHIPILKSVMNDLSCVIMQEFFFCLEIITYINNKKSKFISMHRFLHILTLTYYNFMTKVILKLPVASTLYRKISNSDMIWQLPN